jgi:hypothetical protein
MTQLDSNNITHFDNQLLRNIYYEFDDKVSVNDFKLRQYREKTFGNSEQKIMNSTDNTIHVGPAFNLPYVAAKYNCRDCSSGDLNKIKVNGQDFSSLSKGAHDTYVQVEPSSGYMIS